MAVADGTLEGLKWLGMLLMTIDHANKYIWQGGAPAAYAVGRLCLPIFAFVLAQNLARSSQPVQAARASFRVSRRLALWAALASAPFVALGGLAGGWWPLNVLSTLSLSACIIGLLQRGDRWSAVAAAVLFAVGGTFVEYWWSGVAIAVAAWRWSESGSLLAGAALVLSTASLTVIGWAFAAMPLLNVNLAALAALPLLALAKQVTIPVPRWKWACYLYYPVHLSALVALRASGW